MTTLRRPRMFRLQLLGALAVLCGLGCAGMAALPVLLAVAAPALPGADALQTEPRSLFVNGFVLLSASAALIWLGIGSIGARRWVRPLMLTLAWTWLLCGVVMLPYVVLMLDPLIRSSLPDVPEGAAILGLVKATSLALTIVFWIVLPSVFVAGYQSRRVQQTCEAAHPEPSWTDRCPTPVLSLGVGLGAAAYLALPSAAFAVLPVGPWLLTGWPAVLLTLVGGGVCAWLAASVYALRPSGWWGTLVLTLLLGASFAATLVWVDAIEIYRAIGYPEQQLEAFRQVGGLPVWVALLLVALFTAACVAYLVAIREHFFPAVDRRRP